MAKKTVKQKLKAAAKTTAKKNGSAKVGKNSQTVTKTKTSSSKKSSGDGIQIKPGKITTETGARRFIIRWDISGSNASHTDHFEITWEYGPKAKEWHTASGMPESVTYKSSVRRESGFEAPENAKYIRVKIVAISKKDKNDKKYYSDKSSGWITYESPDGKKATVEDSIVKGKYVIGAITFTEGSDYPLKVVVEGRLYQANDDVGKADTSWSGGFDVNWEFHIKDDNAEYWLDGDSSSHTKGVTEVWYRGNIPNKTCECRVTTVPTSNRAGVEAENDKKKHSFDKTERRIDQKKLTIARYPKGNRQVYATWTIGIVKGLESFSYSFRAYDNTMKRWVSFESGSIPADEVSNIGGTPYWTTPPYTVPDDSTKVNIVVTPVSAETSGYLDASTTSNDFELTIAEEQMAMPTLSILPSNPRTVVAVWDMPKALNKGVGAFEVEWRYRVYDSNIEYMDSSPTSVDVYSPWNAKYDAGEFVSAVYCRVRPIPAYTNAFAGVWSDSATYSFNLEPREVSNLNVRMYDSDVSSRTLTATWSMTELTKVSGYEVEWRYIFDIESDEDLIEEGTTKTISDPAIRNDRYQVPDNVKYVEVRVRPTPEDTASFTPKWSEYKRYQFSPATRTIIDLTITHVEGVDRTIRVSYDIDDEMYVDRYTYEYSSFIRGTWNEPTAGDTIRKAFELEMPTGATEMEIKIKAVDTSGSDIYFICSEAVTVYSYNPPLNGVSQENISLSLQRGSVTTVVATWTPDDYTGVGSYTYNWMYKIGDVWYDGTEGTSSLEAASCTYDAPALARGVRFKVRPEPEYESAFTTEWSEPIVFPLAGDSIPEKPSAPEVSISGLTITARLTSYNEATASIEFNVVYEDGDWGGGLVDVVNNRASFIIDVGAGHVYNIRARGFNSDGEEGEWSEWSEIVAPPLPITAPIDIAALTESSVEVVWEIVPSAKSYVIEYATKARYFDAAPDMIKSVTIEHGNRAEISGLSSEDGTGEWFFRIKVVNDNGESDWSEITSSVVGSVPDAPTTWSSTSTATTNQDIYLYWVHNCVDGSDETAAVLELTINGNTYTIDIVDGVASKSDMGDNIGIIGYDSETGEPIVGDLDLTPYIGEIPDYDASSGSVSYYVLAAGLFESGAIVKWRVRTKGVIDEFGPWSTERYISVYAPPTVRVGVGGGSGSFAEGFERNAYNVYEQTDVVFPEIAGELTSFPMVLYIDSTPVSQTPITYVISLVANTTYSDFDETGKLIQVLAGQEIYRDYINTDKHSFATFIDAGDVNLENDCSYTIRVTVSMDSGLTADGSYTFDTVWEDPEDININVQIGIDDFELVAYISPTCTDLNGALKEGYTLSVYRQNFDGDFTPIAVGIPNEDGSTVTDPHPTLDYARYRVTARDPSTGQTVYFDPTPTEVGCTDIVLQWDETWMAYDDPEYPEDYLEPTWRGSILKLPFNINESNANSLDAELVNYIGRKHPVSYYGTHVGQTATWTSDIIKEDTDTIFALRRLQNWPGDVYVRSPSGVGYWAKVSVSFDINHLDVITPVTIDITRVEGGV